MITTRKAYAENNKLLAKLDEVNERITQDPKKTYLIWKSNMFPGDDSTFSVLASVTIDWGDGDVETFTEEKEAKHQYSDSVAYHLIIITGLKAFSLNMFYNCTGLVGVTIPADVTTISNKAFAGCTNLKTVRLLSTNPPGVQSDSFDDALEKIIVPKSSISTYLSNASWSKYKDKLVYEIDSSDFEDKFWLSGGHALTADSKLDDIKTVGNYYCHEDSIVEKITDFPSFMDKHAFILKVFYGQGTSYVTQYLRSFRSGMCAQRFWHDECYWTEWLPTSVRDLYTVQIKEYTDFMTEVNVLKPIFQSRTTPFFTREDIKLYNYNETQETQSESGFKIEQWSYGFICNCKTTDEVVIYTVGAMNGAKCFVCGVDNESSVVWSVKGADFPYGFNSRLSSKLSETDPWPLSHADLQNSTIITDWRWEATNSVNGDVAFVGVATGEGQSADAKAHLVLDGTVYVNEGKNKVVTDAGGKVAIGSSTVPIYMNNSNQLVASSGTVGGAERPIYMLNGTLTSCTFATKVVSSIPSTLDDSTIYFITED